MNKRDAEKVLRNTIEAHKANDLAAAEKGYLRVLEWFPNHPDANHNLGVIKTQYGEFEAALKFYDKAVELNPHIEQFWVSLFEQKIKCDQTHDMLIRLVEFLDACSNFVLYCKYLQRLENLVDIKYHVPTKNELKAALDAFSKRQYKLALNEVNRLMGKYPAAISLFNLKGTILGELEDNSTALKNYDYAIALRFDLPSVHNNIGNLHKKLGDIDEAISSYKVAIELNDSFSEAHYNLGNVYREKFQMAKAKLHYQNAIDLKDDYFEAHINLGNICKEAGDLSSALEHFAKASIIEGVSAEVFRELGDLHRIRGDVQKAFEFYEIYGDRTSRCTKYKLRIVELSKTFQILKASKNLLLRLDRDVRKHTDSTLYKLSDQELGAKITDLITMISEHDQSLQHSQTQLFIKNGIDLNCKRHFKVFEKASIIPNFCFQCIKVQVTVYNILDLIRLSAIFYCKEFPIKATRKCMIEKRKLVNGHYKGFVYLRNFNEAADTMLFLKAMLKRNHLRGDVIIKRGCSEFSNTYPEYQSVSSDGHTPFIRPKDWDELEQKFDQSYKISAMPTVEIQSSLSFCLSDILVMKNWFQYAKSIGDAKTQYFQVADYWVN